jgi:hypothetical protein
MRERLPQAARLEELFRRLEEKERFGSFEEAYKALVGSKFLAVRT